MACGAQTGNGAMVENSILKIVGGMTKVAVSVGGNMAFMLTCGRNTVVAAGAISGNTGMVKAAICCQFEKTGGIVAVIAFGSRWHMPVGFADGQYTIMAGAAITENFLMINKGDNGKAEG